MLASAASIAAVASCGAAVSGMGGTGTGTGTGTGIGGTGMGGARAVSIIRRIPGQSFKPARTLSSEPAPLWMWASHAFAVSASAAFPAGVAAAAIRGAGAVLAAFACTSAASNR